jgi:tetratricopeptide (TPR) repeat protein
MFLYFVRYQLLIYCLFAMFSILLFVGCHTSKPEKAAEEEIEELVEQSKKQYIQNPEKATRLLQPYTNVESMAHVSDTLASTIIQILAESNLAIGRKDFSIEMIMRYREYAENNSRFPLKLYLDLWLAQRYVDDGKLFLAEKFLEESLELLKVHPEEFYLARAYNLYGSLYSFKGEYSKAQAYLVKAIRSFEKLGKKEALTGVYINIGNNYSELSENQLARKFYDKAMASALIHFDTLNYLISLSSIGRLIQDKQPDSAVYYFTKSLSFNAKPWLVELLSTKFQLATLYVSQKEFKQAFEIFTDIKNTCIDFNIEGGIYRAMSGLGNVYEGMGEDAKAMDQFTKARELAKKAGEAKVELQLLEAIHYMYIKSKKFEKAHEILVEIKASSDSLFALDKQLNVHDLELMYNNQAATLKKHELQANLKLMDEKSQLLKTIIVLSLIFIVILGSVLSLVYRMYRQRNHAYQTLFETLKSKELQLKQLTLDLSLATNESQTEAKNPDMPYQKLLEYFELDKPYLNSQLKIDEVAKALSTTRKALSALVVKHTGLHFVPFVNTYRINEVLRLMENPKYKNYKIEALAKMAGFGSKVSFYSAFGQVIGDKPGTFRNTVSANQGEPA